MEGKGDFMTELILEIYMLTYVNIWTWNYELRDEVVHPISMETVIKFFL